MRKSRGRSKTQEYTSEVLWRFAYCDGIYRTSSKVQCQIVSCLKLILNVQQTRKIKTSISHPKSFKPAQEARR